MLPELKTAKWMANKSHTRKPPRLKADLNVDAGHKKTFQAWKFWKLW